MSLNRWRESTAGWRELGGKKYYFRSLWEANYGKYLQYLKDHHLIKDWEHEPHTFYFEGIKRGTNNYKPDFRVTNTDDSQHWVEVKGYYDQKSRTKIARFKKYFPDQTLILIDRNWFATNNSKMRLLIKGWEVGHENRKGYIGRRHILRLPVVREGAE